ncbi:MAG: NUDIX hydrolase [Methylococcaceae bacterium]|jgi:ADP-ribose pyrophosphatase YjhB (NUDIX family)
MQTIGDKPPPIPAIGVGGIVFNKQNKVLMVQRNQAPAKGLWSIPGGKLETGESLIQACAREVLEETAVSIIPTQILAVVERRIEGFHYVIIDFLAQLQNIELSQATAQSDVLAADWFAMADLKQLNLVIGLMPILEKAYQIHCGGKLLGLQDKQQLGTDFVAVD